MFLDYSLFIFSVAVDLVSQKISFFDDRTNSQSEHRRSLLDDYLMNPRLDLPDILGMACDLLLAGVDTVCVSHYHHHHHHCIINNFLFKSDDLLDMFSIISLGPQSTLPRKSISRNVKYFTGL